MTVRAGVPPLGPGPDNHLILGTWLDHFATRPIVLGNEQIPARVPQGDERVGVVFGIAERRHHSFNDGPAQFHLHPIGEG